MNSNEILRYDNNNSVNNEHLNSIHARKYVEIKLLLSLL
jgi:hypothetical protein